MNKFSALAAIGLAWAMGAGATTFETGGLKYTTLTGSNVALSGYAAGTSTADVTVPGNVTYDGVTYTVTEVGDNAFKGITSLKTMVLPEGVTKLGEAAFASASNLSSLKLPTTLKVISGQAFESTSSLASLELPNGLTTLGDRVFRYGGQTSLVIPGTVSVMGTDMFFSNSKLRYLKYDEGITALPAYGFRGGVVLEELDLPSTLQSIDYWAFVSASGLKTITCRAVNPPNCDSEAFGSWDHSNTVVLVPPASLGAYQGAGVWNTFKVVPNSVGEDFTSDGLKFKTITVTSAQVEGFASTAKSDLKIPAEVTYNGVVYEVTNVGDGAFKDVTVLQNVELPYSINVVGANSFSGCTSLTQIGVGADTPPTCQPGCFEQVSRSDCKLVVAPECLNAYKGADVWKEFTNIVTGPFFAKDFAVELLKYQTITENTAMVTGFAPNKSTSNLTILPEVTFHGITYKVTQVGYKAFQDKSKLQSLTLSEGITKLGKWSFNNCSGLKTVTLPQSLVELEDEVFEGCKTLNNVVLPDNLTVLPYATFNGCYALDQITLPPNLVDLGSSTFSSAGIKSLTLPATLQTIGSYCMSNCHDLALIKCYAVVPPSATASCFTNDPVATARLIVPDESVETYKTTDPWKNFGFILPASQDTEGLMIKELEGVPVKELNKAFNLNFKVVNNETEKITSLTYVLEFNGQSKTVDLDLSNPFVADPVVSADLSIPFDAISTEGQYPGTLTITKINGKDNGATTRANNFFVVATDGTTLPANAFGYTYNSDPVESYLGRMLASELWQGALRIQDPALVGLKVVGFKAWGLHEDNFNEYGWLSTKLQRMPDVTLMTGTRQEKELTVTFVEPYTITADGIYVGYTFQSLNTYPLPYCPAVKGNDNTLFASFNGLPFENYSDMGSLPMTVYLVGDLTENSLALQPYNGSDLAVKGKVYELTFNVNNGGTNAINTIGYTYTINGQNIEGTADVSIESTLGASGQFKVEMAPLEEAGTYPMEITVNKVNGDVNHHYQNSDKLSIRNMHFQPANRPLMEEGTGTWCQWCPAGWKAMELMNEKFPDFVGVAWHNNDPMAITNNYPVPFTAFPNAFINRSSKQMNPFEGETGTEFGIFDTYGAYASQLTVADMNLTTEWNQDKTALKVNATVYFATPCDGYKIGYILGENGYHHPDEAPWYQQNAYSGATGYTGYLQELTQLPNPIKDITYNDVVISDAAARGLANSLPEKADALQEYSFPYTFATESITGIYPKDEGYELIEDRDKMFVVALLIAPDGTVANSCKARAGESFNGSLSVAPLSADVMGQPVYYDLTGRRVEKPAHGNIYIRLQGSHAYKVVM